MYKGFKLEEVDLIDPKAYEIGKGIYDADRKIIKTNLNEFLLKDNSLDGAKISNSWFPLINADVFISHSHADETMAIKLAGWLHNRFKIKAFIDSCVWGYANDLNKLIDDDYSWIDENKNHYEYRKVLYSTSHVHMMLSTALNSMIDKTECLIFLDTPNSIKPYRDIDKTESPWIFAEIAMTHLIKINIPLRLRILKETRTFDTGGPIADASKLIIKHDLNSNNLTEINIDTLHHWASMPSANAEKALDILYMITSTVVKR